jgi:hypothetical protein
MSHQYQELLTFLCHTTNQASFTIELCLIQNETVKGTADKYEVKLEFTNLALQLK